MFFPHIGRQLKTESENRGLLFNFRSQLDQSLGLLHNTVVGSICEQQQVLESMTEQMNSYFSAKSEVLLVKYLFLFKIQVYHYYPTD